MLCTAAFWCHSTLPLAPHVVTIQAWPNLPVTIEEWQIGLGSQLELIRDDRVTGQLAAPG